MTTFGTRVAYVIPLPWPYIPEPAASTRCDRCSWCWRDGRPRIKFICAACVIHGRYLERPP